MRVRRSPELRRTRAEDLRAREKARVNLETDGGDERHSRGIVALRFSEAARAHRRAPEARIVAQIVARRRRAPRVAGGKREARRHRDPKVVIEAAPAGAEEMGLPPLPGR